MITLDHWEGAPSIAFRGAGSLKYWDGEPQAALISTNIYADFVNGSDETGTGEASNPFKTIDKATYMLEAGIGNEVRCAKGSDNTILPGVMTWVDGDDEVLTSNDLTTYLSSKDFVKKNSSEKKPWEILSVASDKIILVGSYRGTSETIESIKIGTADTGVAEVGQSIQKINFGGYSYPPDQNQKGLKISGGWDLSLNPPIQNGETWFRQTGDNRCGIGLNANGKDWIYISKLNFLRYDQGIYNPTSTICVYWILDEIIGVNQSAGLSLRYMERSIFKNSIGEGIGALGAGIELNECSGLCGVYDSLAYGDYGININKSANALIRGIDYLGVGNPVRLKAANFNRISECDFGGGLVLVERGCIENRFYECELSSDFVEFAFADFQKVPAALFKSCNSTPGSERAYYNDRGYIEKDNLSGTICAGIAPKTSTTYGNIIWSNYLPVIEGQALNVSLWGRMSADFDGAVYYDLLTSEGVSIYSEDEFFDSFQELPDFLTETWTKKTIQLSGNLVTKTGALELLIKIIGSQGKIYLNKLGFEAYA